MGIPCIDIACPASFRLRASWRVYATGWAQQALYSDRIVSVEMGECRAAYPAGSAVLIGLNPLGFTVVALE